jgi:PKD repeat protein
LSEKTKRGLEISITAVFVLALLLVGAVLVFSGGTASAKQFATLRLLDGQVAVQRGSGAFETGEDGTSLREGDTVRTGPDGRASIEYFDGSLTRLDFDTSFTLVTLETLGNEATSKVLETSQADGNSYQQVAELVDAESRFETETPTATASVHGTEYALLVSQGSTTIAVVSGVVTVGGATTSVDVPAGKMVIVGTGGTVGPIQDIPRELFESDWFRFNRCQTDDVTACDEGNGEEPPGPTGHPDGSGEGDQGATPPTSNAGNGGGDEGGTTGDGPPPPPPLNQPPQAGFTASPQLGPAPLRVRFTDASHDPDGDLVSRHWSFGDGSTRSGGLSQTHVFRDPGDYTVTLRVSDPDGERDSSSKVIHVGSVGDHGPPNVKITDAPADPSDSRNAHFSFTSDEEGRGFECTLDGDREPCGGRGTAGPNTAAVSGSINYTNLSQGPHAFSVSMTDASGNTGTASYSWTIDTGGGVEPAFDHIVISPANATIQPGDSQAYSAEAFDTNGGSMGNVTAHTTFSIAPNGSCNGHTCSAQQPGAHTVTGTYSGDSDSATLSVEEASPPPSTCPNYALSFHTRPPTSQGAGHQFIVQIKVDVLEGGSSDGPLDIQLSLQGGNFSGGETSTTWTGQGILTFNHLTIDEAGTYGISASASCASSTDVATITIDDGPNGRAGAALGLVLAIPGRRWFSSRR